MSVEEGRARKPTSFYKSLVLCRDSKSRRQPNNYVCVMVRVAADVITCQVGPSTNAWLCTGSTPQCSTNLTKRARTALRSSSSCVAVFKSKIFRSTLHREPISPQENMSVALILSHNDLRNTTFDCDSLGIHYQVTSKVGLSRLEKLPKSADGTVSRGSSSSLRNGNAIIFNRMSSNSPRRTGGDSVPVSMFLTRKSGFTKTLVCFSVVSAPSRNPDQYLYK